MQTISNVKKWGNSLAVRIPTAVAQDLGLSENSSVRIISDGAVATIKPERPKKVTLNELVNSITPQNRHNAVDWGKPVGKEIW